MLYRETHVLLDELAEASIDGTRKQLMESLMAVPLLFLPKTRFSLSRLLLARHINKLLGDDPGTDFLSHNPA